MRATPHLFAILMALAAASLVAAQQQRPVFRAGIDVVLIDVTVVDDDGVPVRGLTMDDFVVTVDGEPRRIQALDFLEFGRSADTGIAPQPAGAAAGASVKTRGGRVIVVVVDDLSVRPGEGSGLLAAAERVLGALDPSDLVGLVTTSGFGPVLSPTTDRAAFRAALHRREIAGRNDSVSEYYVSAYEAFQLDELTRGLPPGVLKRECTGAADPTCADRLRGIARRLAVEWRNRRDQQLDAYAAIFEAMQTLPRPRVLIAMGRGLASDGRAQSDAIEKLGHLAAAADVRFYALSDTNTSSSLMTRRTGTPPNCGDPACNPYLARRDEAEFLHGGVQTIASAAGGQAFRVIGQADRFLKRVLSETSAVYRLGVEVPAGTGTESFPSLRVTTRRRGVTVRASRHLAQPGVRATMPIDQALSARVAQGGYEFAVPIAIATMMRGDPRGGRHEIGVTARVPADVPGPLSMAFALLDATGQLHASGQRTIASAAAGADFEASFLLVAPPVPGAYRLRFAVADASGRIGSVDRRVAPGYASAGAFLATEIFINWAARDGRPRFAAFGTLPEDATIISCAIELYPKADARVPDDVRVRFSLVSATGGTPISRDVAAMRAGTGLSAVATLPLAGVPAGAYTVRAAIAAAGVRVGQQSASVVIER